MNADGSQLGQLTHTERGDNSPSWSPETRVLALSAHQDRATVLQMLGAGAIGYLVKGVAAEEIVVAIERAGRGQTSVSSEVMAGVVRELTTRLRREKVGASQVREKTARIRRAIGGAGLSLVYQPIFDLGRRTVVGHEALARFALPPDRLRSNLVASRAIT